MSQDLDMDLDRPELDLGMENSVLPFLRQDRIPHIWCPGCGIGTTVNCFCRALGDSGLDLDQVAIVSGIGCTGRTAGYLNLDSFHTTHGRAIPFATGLKLANPRLKVVVYSGDGDLSAIGGNHLMHAARRNMDIMVVCVNNFTYGMTGGQVAPTRSTCPSWPTPAARSTWPAGPSSTPASWPRPCAKAYRRRASSSSRRWPPAPPCTPGATAWATGWTR